MIISNRTKFLYYLGNLFTFAKNANIEVICFTFYRSPAEQYQQYLKGNSKIKDNGPHQKWLAIDLAIIENGEALFDRTPETIAKYKRLGDFWKTLDSKNIWGGDFKFAADIYHFELGV